MPFSLRTPFSISKNLQVYYSIRTLFNIKFILTTYFLGRASLWRVEGGYKREISLICLSVCSLFFSRISISLDKSGSEAY